MSSCEPVFIEVVTCSCIVFKINVDCVPEIKSLTAVVEGLKQGIFILCTVYSYMVYYIMYSASVSNAQR